MGFSGNTCSYRSILLMTKSNVLDMSVDVVITGRDREFSVGGRE